MATHSRRQYLDIREELDRSFLPQGHKALVHIPHNSRKIHRENKEHHNLPLPAARNDTSLWEGNGHQQADAVDPPSKTPQAEQNVYQTRGPTYDKDQTSSHQSSNTAQAKGMAFDVVHDPSRSSKDINIRLEMPIEEDISPDMESFCRFRRLGQFKDARNLYTSRLGQHNTDPYIAIHYAEMLIASGDYRGFRELLYPDVSPKTGVEKSANLILKTNFELLRPLLVIWGCISPYLRGTVEYALDNLKGESTIGSTEIQLYALCLRVLNYLRNSYHEEIVYQATEIAKKTFDWRTLYCQLLGEDRIWDLRDLLVATISLFGWDWTASTIFESQDLHKLLEIIHHDWFQSVDEECTILGLLDIFTSLILETRPRGAIRPALLEALTKHARILAEIAQRCGPNVMTTRPFIQWILAKTVSELRPVGRYQDENIGDFDGLLVDQGENIQLPVFVPVDHSKKPHWRAFSVTSTAAQRSAVKVAYRAAIHTDDLHLQAMALKLLCLLSQDPTGPLKTLTLLQMSMQGDTDGLLGTYLSRYMLVQNPQEAKDLLEELTGLDNASEESLLASGANPSLLWSRDVIQGHLVASTAGHKTATTTGWERNLRIYGSRLPGYIAKFIKGHFYLAVPPPISPPTRVSRSPKAQNDQRPSQDARKPSKPMATTHTLPSHLSEMDIGHETRNAQQFEATENVHLGHTVQSQAPLQDPHTLRPLSPSGLRYDYVPYSARPYTTRSLSPSRSPDVHTQPRRSSRSPTELDDYRRSLRDTSSKVPIFPRYRSEDQSLPKAMRPSEDAVSRVSKSTLPSAFRDKLVYEDPENGSLVLRNGGDDESERGVHHSVVEVKVNHRHPEEAARIQAGISKTLNEMWGEGSFRMTDIEQPGRHQERDWDHGRQFQLASRNPVQPPIYPGNTRPLVTMHKVARGSSEPKDMAVPRRTPSRRPEMAQTPRPSSLREEALQRFVEDQQMQDELRQGEKDFAYIGAQTTAHIQSPTREQFVSFQQELEEQRKQNELRRKELSSRKKKDFAHMLAQMEAAKLEAQMIAEEEKRHGSTYFHPGKLHMPNGASVPIGLPRRVSRKQVARFNPHPDYIPNPEYTEEDDTTVVASENHTLVSGYNPERPRPNYRPSGARIVDHYDDDIDIPTKHRSVPDPAVDLGEAENGQQVSNSNTNTLSGSASLPATLAQEKENPTPVRHSNEKDDWSEDDFWNAYKKPVGHSTKKDDWPVNNFPWDDVPIKRSRKKNDRPGNLREQQQEVIDTDKARNSASETAATEPHTTFEPQSLNRRGTGETWATVSSYDEDEDAIEREDTYIVHQLDNKPHESNPPSPGPSRPETPEAVMETKVDNAQVEVEDEPALPTEERVDGDDDGAPTVEEAIEPVTTLDTEREESAGAGAGDDDGTGTEGITREEHGKTPDVGNGENMQKVEEWVQSSSDRGCEVDSTRLTPATAHVFVSDDTTEPNNGEE